MIQSNLQYLFANVNNNIVVIVALEIIKILPKIFVVYALVRVSVCMFVSVCVSYCRTCVRVRGHRYSVCTHAFSAHVRLFSDWFPFYYAQLPQPPAPPARHTRTTWCVGECRDAVDCRYAYALSGNSNRICVLKIISHHKLIEVLLQMPHIHRSFSYKP